MPLVFAKTAAAAAPAAAAAAAAAAVPQAGSPTYWPTSLETSPTTERTRTTTFPTLSSEEEEPVVQKDPYLEAFREMATPQEEPPAASVEAVAPARPTAQEGLPPHPTVREGAPPDSVPTTEVAPGAAPHGADFGPGGEREGLSNSPFAAYNPETAVFRQSASPLPTQKAPLSPPPASSSLFSEAPAHILSPSAGPPASDVQGEDKQQPPPSSSACSLPPSTPPTTATVAVVEAVATATDGIGCGGSRVVGSIGSVGVVVAVLVILGFQATPIAAQGEALGAAFGAAEVVLGYSPAAPLWAGLSELISPGFVLNWASKLGV